MPTPSTPPAPPAATPGLRAVRASLTPTTLRAPGPGHVALQTATRQDFYEGNALHIEEPVDVDDLDRWIAAFDERLGHLPGVRHRRLLWETGRVFDDAGAYHERLAAAAEARGMELDRLTLMELGDELRPMAPLTEGVEIVRAQRDEHWWGVRALKISENTQVDSEFWTYRTGHHRELAEAGRGGTWLAYRFGIPVAVGSLYRDGEGIAVVDDVITHAVHRRLGIASHLVAVACGAHREAFPQDRILLHTDHGSDAERLYARLGFAPIGTVWILTEVPKDPA